MADGRRLARCRAAGSRTLANVIRRIKPDRTPVVDANVRIVQIAAVLIAPVSANNRLEHVAHARRALGFGAVASAGPGTAAQKKTARAPLEHPGLTCDGT
jgi:hypothetical protein